MKILKSLDKNIGKELIEDGYIKMSQILVILIVILYGPISLILHILYYYFIAHDQIFASDAQILINNFVFDVVTYIICNTDLERSRSNS